MAAPPREWVFIRVQGELKAVFGVLPFAKSPEQNGAVVH